MAEAAREIRRLVFETPGFASCTVLLPEGLPDGHTKATIRPVEIDGRQEFQRTLSGGRGVLVANFARGPMRDWLEEALRGATEAHVATVSVDYHLRLSKKGKVLVSRSRPLHRDAPAPRGHDHEKDYPLRRFDSAPLLRALGFADARDALLPSMNAKYRQVNEFLRILDAVLPAAENDDADAAPFTLLDAGCGKAYLSIAARGYLAATRRRPVRLVGVNLRDDVIATCRATAERLGLSEGEARFAVADIASFDPAPLAPDCVVSLHACDTATDEAIARGVEWNAPLILSVPCCQHDIQKHLGTAGPQRAVLRHGILRERVADILADAFRAQILRILGYRVRVIEFVDPDATARNIMIRAERGVRPGAADAVAEYLDLRDAWKVAPYLETRLASRLSPFLK